MKKLRIAVDLVPLLPGGANGGAKWATIDLLNGLARRGVTLICFCQSTAQDDLRDKLISSITVLAVPDGADIRDLAKEQDDAVGLFDLLFFPFHRISFRLREVPAVSVLHDIQFRDMPQNFSPAEFVEREQTLQNGLTGADRVITISNFVRGSIARNTEFPKERIDVSYILTKDALAPVRGTAAEEGAVLARHGLERGGYVIYPANFWEHKNHRTLIAAYLLYLKRTAHPLKLVFTGDLKSPLGHEIRDLAGDLVEDRILVTGFVSADEVRALLANARAMVFPSLYEGFGMPLVEAMALGVPIAASWTTCIPEVAGEAALLFDPQQPRAICDALLAITQDDDARARLLAAAPARLAALGGHEQMVDQYLHSFERALTDERPKRDGASEVSMDHWIGASATFTAGARPEAQRLEIVLEVPSFAPEEIEVEAESSEVGAHRFTLARGRRYLLADALPASGGRITVRPSWTFIPERDLNAPGDKRTLSLRCDNVIIRHDARTTVLIGDPDVETPNIGSGAVVALIGAAAGRRNRVVVGGTGTLVPSRAEIELSGLQDLVVFVPAGGDAPPMSEHLIAGPNGSEGPVRITLNNLDGDRLFRAEGSLSPRVDAIRAEAAYGDKPAPILVSRSKPIGAPAKLPAVAKTAGSFSVVTPSFNQGEFIGRTIESVLTQARIADYHIFDAVSTDETAREASRFGDRVRFVSERDGGQADAVNKGIQAGRGDYIAWLNSDDTYASGAFDHVARIFETEPDIDVVYGEAFHIDTADRIIDRYPTEEFRLTRLIETCFLCQPATFFRRSLVERIGGLRADLQYCMDYELWLRMAMAGARFRRTGSFLANSRLYETNKTAGARVNVHREVNDMMTQCFRVSPDKWLNAFSRILIEEKLDLPVSEARPMQRDVRRLGELFWRFAPAPEKEAAPQEEQVAAPQDGKMPVPPEEQEPGPHGLVRSSAPFGRTLRSALQQFGRRGSRA
jgi:glycosyltransferase involved in cell wall biosynthesis